MNFTFYSTTIRALWIQHILLTTVHIYIYISYTKYGPRYPTQQVHLWPTHLPSLHTILMGNALSPSHSTLMAHPSSHPHKQIYGPHALLPSHTILMAKPTKHFCTLRSLTEKIFVPDKLFDLTILCRHLRDMKCDPLWYNFD